MWLRLTPILLFFVFLLSRCATESGSGAPIAGSPVIFTYDNGQMGVVVNVEYPKVTAAAILYDIHPETGLRAQATELDAGVSVDWPTDVSFTLPGCGGTPTLSTADTYTTYKIFNYDYPSSCASPIGDVVGTATLVVHKSGLPDKTLNGSGSSGETFHTAFVTSLTYDGNMGGLAGADNLCALRAAAGSQTSSLSGTWKAVLGTSAVQAKDRFSFYASAPVKNTNGETVTSSGTDLWSGTLLAPIKYDEDGALVTVTIRTWTGANTDGTNGGVINSYCMDWTSGAAGVDGFWGTPTSITGTWLYDNIPFEDSCSNTRRLYCINSN